MISTDIQARQTPALAIILLVALAYFLTGKLGLLLAIPPGFASAVWPPSGIALAAVLLWGYRAVPGVFLGSALLNTMQSLSGIEMHQLLHSARIALPIGLGASLQALLGTWLVRRYVGFPTAFVEIREIAVFSLLGGPVACLVGASGGSLNLYGVGLISQETLGLSWITWWVGDVIGVLVFTPLLLILSQKQPQELSSRRIQIALPLAFVFTIAVALFAWTRDSAQERIGDDFTRLALIETQIFERQLGYVLSGLSAVKGLFIASEEVTVDEFERFYRQLNHNFPGLEIISWIERVPHDQRRAFEEELRQNGAPLPYIRELFHGELVSAAPRDEYLAIRYNSTGAGYNNPIIGFNPGTEPRRAAAIERSRRLGAISASAPLTLARNRDRENAIVVFQPVFSRDLPSVDNAESNELAGLVAGLFHVGTLLEENLTEQIRSDLNILVTDVTDKNHPVTLYGNHNQQRSAFTWQKPLDFAGRQWIIKITPTARYLKDHQDWSTWWTLIGAMLFVWVTGALLLLITGREMQVRQQVIEKTSQLRKALSQAESANHAKSQFLASMSHELRTPLNSIIGFTRRLIRTANDEQRRDTKLMDSLDIIKRNGEQLLELINDVLDVAKIEAGEMTLNLEKVSVCHLMQELSNKVRPLALDKHLMIVTQTPQPDILIQADSRRLQQILLNLLSNSIKFTPEGKITLSAKGMDYKDRSGVLFSVKDTGIGISTDDQKRLFQRFSQISNTEVNTIEGTGLGLVLVKEFSEMHGGFVQLESDMDQGSQFDVWLPQDAHLN
ncbi:hypothetical protein HBA55_15685 [Pseudomaricurvus alkylphenolicus]|uniref:CHASE domain-containing protein n=1 Tax=Pseudomaricurvus alkylphenolicus TaxID=1306991 RepID=UPI001420761B|nr:hypothetical protein [Pseudomaricurvus alkylphenolicus]